MIIAIVQEKGGMAKSVSALTLAAALHKSGKSVALVDVDPQASLTMYCEPIEYLTCYTPALANMTRVVTALDAEYIFIDTPSRLGPETQTALQLSDTAIIATAAEYAAVQQLDATVRFVQAQPNQPRPRILLTRYDTRSGHSAGIEETVREQYRKLVYPVCIRENVAVKDSHIAGQTVLDYAPRSAAAAGYREVANLLIKENKRKR